VIRFLCGELVFKEICMYIKRNDRESIERQKNNKKDSERRNERKKERERVSVLG
jgi:hypothetical protein